MNTREGVLAVCRPFHRQPSATNRRHSQKARRMWRPSPAAPIIEANPYFASWNEGCNSQFLTDYCLCTRLTQKGYPFLCRPFSLSSYFTASLLSSRFSQTYIPVRRFSFSWFYPGHTLVLYCLSYLEISHTPSTRTTHTSYRYTLPPHQNVAPLYHPLHGLAGFPRPRQNRPHRLHIHRRVQPGRRQHRLVRPRHRRALRLPRLRRWSRSTNYHRSWLPSLQRQRLIFSLVPRGLWQHDR